MADAVLIYADSIRSPEQRHEVPVAITDEFLYAAMNGRRVVVATSFELDRVREADAGLEALPLEEFGWDDMIKEGLTRAEMELEHVRRACERFGIQAAIVPSDFPLELADFLRAHGVEVTPNRKHFRAQRRVKNEAELAGIRRAQRGAEAGMRAGAELLRRAEPNGNRLVLDGEPLTCERLKVAVESAFSQHSVVGDEFIVSHGAQTAVGHDMGSGEIAPNEPIIFDLFPRDRSSGCYSDMTRTFVVGDAPEELIEYQRLCAEALDRAYELIKPGAKGRDVYTATCEFFHRHGYPTQLSKKSGEVLDRGFYHGLGHGVGLEVHEEPSLGRYPGELIAGDVVAVEPGLYRPGFGGCRLEDLVRVTDDGAEVLTDYPYELAP